MTDAVKVDSDISDIINVLISEDYKYSIENIGLLYVDFVMSQNSPKIEPSNWRQAVKFKKRFENRCMSYYAGATYIETHMDMKTHFLEPVYHKKYKRKSQEDILAEAHSRVDGRQIKYHDAVENIEKYVGKILGKHGQEAFKIIGEAIKTGFDKYKNFRANKENRFKIHQEYNFVFDELKAANKK